MTRHLIGAFIAGAIAAAAVGRSVYAFRRYPSFGKWWDAEGLPIWMMAGMFIFLFLTI